MTTITIKQLTQQQPQNNKKNIWNLKCHVYIIINLEKLGMEAATIK